MTTSAHENARRIARLQTDEYLRRRVYVQARIVDTSDGAVTTPYRAYDGVVSQSGTALTFLRRSLIARVNGTLDAQVSAMPETLRVKFAPMLTLCIPPHQTYDATPLARGFYADYAAACMACGNIPQVIHWLEAYRAKAESRDATALENLTQRTIRGLSLLAAYFRNADTGDNYAIQAVLTQAAEREFSAQAHAYWHVLTDATRGAPKTRKAQRIKNGHHERRKAERASGKRAHH